VKNAASLIELEQAEQLHGPSFNFIHISAAFNRAGQLASGRGAAPPASFHPLLRSLWCRLQPQMGECDARALSNVVWACGKAGYADAALLDGCIAGLVGMTPGVQTQDVANVVYAAALLQKLDYRMNEQHAQQLVAALVQNVQQAKTQEIANTLWAAASLGLAIPAQHAQGLVAALVQQGQRANAQEITNTLWAAATMGLTIPAQQSHELVAALVQQLQHAQPQSIANTMWAAATMGLTIPLHHARQLVEGLVHQVQHAKPQEIANTLWAAATMGLAIAAQDAQQLVAAVVQQAHHAKPQDFTNTLWAAATMGLPIHAEHAQQLVAAVVQQVHHASPQDLSQTLWAAATLRLPIPAHDAQQLVAGVVQQAQHAKPLDFANTAIALAKLGLNDADLFDAPTAAARPDLLEQFESQHLCNFCWALGVADQRQLADHAVGLARQVGEDSMWRQTSAENWRQLHQAHLWVLAAQPKSQGLAGVLSPVQLQQCEDDRREQLVKTGQQRRTKFEQSVYDCCCSEQLQQGVLSDCRQEALTEDGALSVDVLATHTASGRRLAIEADGPTHFLEPGRKLTGETLARNRALAARGYVVVSVPWWEWGEVRSESDRAAYLSGKVKVALLRQHTQQKVAGASLGEGASEAAAAGGAADEAAVGGAGHAAAGSDAADAAAVGGAAQAS